MQVRGWWLDHSSSGKRSVCEYGLRMEGQDLLMERVGQRRGEKGQTGPKQLEERRSDEVAERGAGWSGESRV